MNVTTSQVQAERLFQCLICYVRDNWVPLLSSILFGLMAYGYAFTNKFLNHDEVGQLFSKGATIDSGRWGLELMELIFPNYSMPWIYGLISLTLIAIAISLIVNIFTIRSKLLQVLLSGCIIVFPSLTGLFGFMFTSTSYAVAFLLAVEGVYLIRGRKSVYVRGGGCALCNSLFGNIPGVYFSCRGASCGTFDSRYSA